LTLPTLKIASFNMQAGIGSHRPRHFITYGWRYLFPHKSSHDNLNIISNALAPFDIVGLQEADAGSFRSNFVHQQEFLARQAGFHHTRSLITREFSTMACISMGVLSRLPINYTCEHRLPGSRHGRGALEISIPWQGKDIAIITTHLSLQQHSRMRQLRYLASLVNRHPSAIIMGDFNCAPDSREMALLLNHTRLHFSSTPSPCTFPSWQPRRRLDHILATGDIEISKLATLPLLCSDHLPITAEICLR